MLRPVYGPPRQVKWFVGLQLLGLAYAGFLIVMVWNDLGLKPPSWFHGVFILFLVLGIEVFLLWKVWSGKNWARLTMLAWFLWACVQTIVPSAPPAIPIHISVGLKAIGIVLTILQAFSFAILFVNPANEWFRPAPAKKSLLFPQ